MFQHFFEARLSDCAGVLRGTHNVELARVREAALALGFAILRDRRGLEVDHSWAVAQISSDADEGARLLAGMVDMRLIRRSANGRRVSFVHRRFAEYFAVRHLSDTPAPAAGATDGIVPPEGAVPRVALPLKDILGDSGWRDALVLYCGIATHDQREIVARYCWARAREMVRWRAGPGPALLAADTETDPAAGAHDPAERAHYPVKEPRSEAIHALRFLNDAFSARPKADAPDPLGSFRAELSQMIEMLVSHSDPLVAKLATEAIPLTNGREQQAALVRALSGQSAYVREAAFVACRRIATLSGPALNELNDYLEELTLLERLTRFSELDFSLSLSDATRPVRTAFRRSAAKAALLVSAAPFAATVAVVSISVIAPLHVAVALFVLWAAVTALVGRFAIGIAPAGAKRSARDVGYVLFAAIAIVGSAAPLYYLSFKLLPPGTDDSSVWKEVRITLVFATGGLAWFALCIVFFSKRRPSVAIVPELTFWVLASVGFVVLVFYPPTLIKFGEYLCVGFGAIASGIVLTPQIPHAYRAVRGWIDVRRDHRRIRELGLPQRVNLPVLFDTLRGFRTAAGRLEYLTSLFDMKSPLPPENGKLPDLTPPDDVAAFFSSESQLADAWARLREYWLGL